MANILLLGGTGAIGFYLAPQLQTCGHNVSCTTRHARPGFYNECDGITYISGNALSKHWIYEYLHDKQYDCIIDFMNYSTISFIDRLEILLSKTSHYVFLSSYRVYADSGLSPLHEDSPLLLNTCVDDTYLATDEYGLSKARQEKILANSRYKNWTIVRPGITYSRYRFQLCTLEANTVCFRSLRKMLVALPIEMMDKYTTMTWAGDVSKLISRIILRSDTLAETYNLSTAEKRKWSEVLSVYRNVLSLSPKFMSTKSYERIVSNHYQIWYDRMFNRIMDNSKILLASGMDASELKLMPEGLSMELREFIRHPVYQYPNLEVNARMDKALRIHLSPLTVSKSDWFAYARIRYPGNLKVMLFLVYIVQWASWTLRVRP